MLNFENDLNERQLQAALHVEGPLLVIAGAGSGKTRVITYRVANLVQNCGIRPWRILAVTFTNKAAKEMRERVIGLLGAQGNDCWVSTFHSTCARLLRKHGELVGISPTFTIYDDSDQKAMVARCLKELALSDKQFAPRTIQHDINRSKRELIGPDDYAVDGFYRERVQQIYQLYEKRMNDAKALDFGDLLYRTAVGMRGNGEMAQAIASRFDFILVDEFQDTNRVQLEIVRLLARPHGNVCVVGDDDQSIYSWRGADVGNILDFERVFPGTTHVTLDRNYRSTGNILKAAHGVVDKLLRRRPKELWTSNDPGERIAYLQCDDEREEARLVARAIRELTDDGYPLREQAVFYRTNAQSRVFEEVFRTLSIPHRVVGGMRFYERAEVKDLLAYLRLIQNTGDLAAFLRVINTPARGIGKTTVERLLAVAAGRGISAYDAIDHAAGDISPAFAKRLAGFKALIESWRAEIESGPAHLATRVLDDTGYVAALKAEDSAESDSRLENLQELVGSIEDFEAESDTPTLETFLELIALQTDIDQVNFDGDQVTLMTVHAAKGLEFDVVHITGLEDGLFPYRQGSRDWSLDQDPEEMEEERRLFYVAMTRARRRVLMTQARVRRLFGQPRMDPPSRFLADVPDDLIQDLSPSRIDVRPVSRPSAGQWSRRPAPTAFKRPMAEKPAAETTWIDRSYDQSAESAAVQPGQKVRHARFGVGQVVAVHAGVKPKVDVTFTGYGIKTILLDYLELG